MDYQLTQLNKYCELNDEIEKIKNILGKIQNDAKNKIKLASTENQKEKIITEFRANIDLMKKDQKMLDKYKQLLIDQNLIRQQLIIKK
jgi:hypothetical protein